MKSITKCRLKRVKTRFYQKVSNLSSKLLETLVALKIVRKYINTEMMPMKVNPAIKDLPPVITEKGEFSVSYLAEIQKWETTHTYEFLGKTIKEVELPPSFLNKYTYHIDCVKWVFNCEGNEVVVDRSNGFTQKIVFPKTPKNVILQCAMNGTIEHEEVMLNTYEKWINFSDVRFKSCIEVDGNISESELDFSLNQQYAQIVQECNSGSIFNAVSKKFYV